MNHTFKFSLNTLNHLWRKLYRNFMTVLGEAISNSWDADATTVWISIDRNQNTMLIQDDGTGMNNSDFAKKFLNIWYSKREDGSYTTPKWRTVIGRKWIGKLALLSCAEVITIITKKQWEEITGWIINNTQLDTLITENPLSDSHDYKLPQLTENHKKLFHSNLESGTAIYFENILISNTEDHIRKILALYFQFSLIDPNFSIILNNKKISHDDLVVLYDKTQFVWTIGNFTPPLEGKTVKNIDNTPSISGFIASTTKPRDLQILWLDEKIWIDLFVNWRVRETNILKHFPDFSSRYVASYLYWQLHINMLDTWDTEDIFNSSRDWILPWSKIFNEQKPYIENILNTVSKEWDIKRREVWDLWDIDSKNIKLSRSESLTEQSKTTRSKEIATEIENNKNMDMEVKEELIKELQRLSISSITIYQDLFILENLLRHYLRTKNFEQEITNWEILKKCKTKDESDTINSPIEIQKIHVQSEIWHDLEGKILKDYNSVLNFATMSILLKCMDIYAKNLTWDDRKKLPKSISNMADPRIIPIRNAIMHTNQITEDAKQDTYIKRIIEIINELP